MNLTPTQLRVRWSCNIRTIQRMLEQGVLTYIKISRSHQLIPLAEIEAYEASHTVKARTNHNSLAAFKKTKECERQLAATAKGTTEEKP